jgi:hypothetical protein
VLTHVSSPFELGYFGDRVLLFAQADLGSDPPVYASHCSWDDRRLPPHRTFSVVTDFAQADLKQ